MSRSDMIAVGQKEAWDVYTFQIGASMDIKIAGTEFSLQRKAFEIYVQGCYRNCVGCHNPETQPFSGGTLVDIDKFIDEQAVRVKMFDNIVENIYVTGGDLLCYVDKIAEEFSVNVLVAWYNKFKWLFTGADEEDIPPWVWDYYDIVKCGAYRQDLRQEDGTFPASSNQKLLFNSRVRDKPTLYGVSPYALEDMYNNIDFKGEKKWI